jgi:hypothetical protein
MESVIIVAPHVYDAELKARLSRTWSVTDTDTGGSVIEDRGARLYVSRNDSVAGDMEREVLARIVATTREPVFYTVDFSDLDLCRRVLIAVADDPLLLIDNDHGVLLTGTDFVRVLRSQPDWDWRQDAVS